MRAIPRLTGLVTAAIGAAAALATAGGPALAAPAARQSPAVVTGYNILNSVAVASSANAWAVGSVRHGSVTRTLAEHWNGTTLSLVPSPSPGGTTGLSLLDGVAVRSGGALAVGWYRKGNARQTLTERWNGTAWKVVPSPDPGGSAHANYLSKVAYISRSQAWAVGDYRAGNTDQALAERWNGTAWKVVPTPRLGHSYLEGIAVVSADDAWAVGSYFTSTSPVRTLIEHWNGKAWKQVRSPNPSVHGVNLESVTAVSRSDAWAVGYFNDGHGDKTLILHWNGRSWRRVATPDPSGVDYNVLNGVTATSSLRAWAVGTYGSTVDADRTLILRWNGASWKQVASPNPSTAQNFLLGVAMTRGAAPWAVGLDGTGNPAYTLAEHWTASGWTQVPSPSK